MDIQRPVDPRLSYTSNVVKRPRLSDGPGQQPSSDDFQDRPTTTFPLSGIKPCIMLNNPTDGAQPSSLNISTNDLHSQIPPSFRSPSLSVPVDTTKASLDLIKSRIIDKKKQLQSWRALMEEFPSMSSTFTMQIERNERELQNLEMELQKVSGCQS